MKRLITLFFFIATTLSCYSQDCTKLPERFTSYTQAISLIKRSTFKIEETANTSSSSWLVSTKYYSCNGITGYLIYTTNRGYEYIHKGVPFNVWNGFKNASSKGSYYNANLKNRYQVKLK
jgi:hypothetical protein